jgi:hypothetical protein
LEHDDGAEVVEAYAPPKKIRDGKRRSYVWKWREDGISGYLVDAETGEISSPTPSVLDLLKEEVSNAGTMGGDHNITSDTPTPAEWRNPRAYL